MESNPVTTKLLIKILLILIIAEGLAQIGVRWLPMPPLAVLGIVRVMQITGMLWVVHRWGGGWQAIGWSPATWTSGLLKGALWSLGFGLLAATGAAVILLSGHNPLQWLRFPLPAKVLDLALYFLVGGLIAPIAEEICFRGVVYTYLRELVLAIGPIFRTRRRDQGNPSASMNVSAILIAGIASTALFASLHAVHGIPVTQIVGGVIFALAYESSRNLMVPMMIHATGNLALFTLAMLAG